MPEFVAPGTYVDETGLRAHRMAGAATSHAGFVGTAEAGPVGMASAALTSFAEYQRIYGTSGGLTPAVRGYFENGGRQLHVVRVAALEEDAEPSVAAYYAALNALVPVNDISIVAAPGSSALKPETARAVAQALIDHAEANGAYRFAVLDAPPAATIAQVRAYRALFDSDFAALYYPWLKVAGPETGVVTLVPPSGHVCGIYARVDIERGVHKAPANEVVRGITGFEQAISKSEQELLNPESVNCFRDFPGRGLRLWGARTTSSDPEWKYVNVRRYVTYLRLSLNRGLAWAAFEPNGEALWVQVRKSVENFLFTEWRSGALPGAQTQDGFFVRCDHTTMSQDDMNEGRLICQIGVATLRPAEFIIFNVSTKTSAAAA